NRLGPSIEVPDPVFRGGSYVQVLVWVVQYGSRGPILGLGLRVPRLSLFLGPSLALDVRVLSQYLVPMYGVRGLGPRPHPVSEVLGSALGLSPSFTFT
uniref:Uncharacterized protein n=1 Tax=Cannabis sativa TaxID=3483 RepID=A0A803PKS3_CANSA